MEAWTLQFSTTDTLITSVVKRGNAVSRCCSLNRSSSASCRPKAYADLDRLLGGEATWRLCNQVDLLGRCQSRGIQGIAGIGGTEKKKMINQSRRVGKRSTTGDAITIMRPIRLFWARTEAKRMEEGRMDDGNIITAASRHGG
jgi:hypothetical protein